jgi:hypothetical protein
MDGDVKILCGDGGSNGRTADREEEPIASAVLRRISGAELPGIT